MLLQNESPKFVLTAAHGRKGMQSLAQVILNIAKYGSSTDANAKVSEKLKDTCNSDFPFKAEL